MDIEILISSKEIKNRIDIIGKEITSAYEGKSPVLVSILKGSFVFLADLSRAINLPISIDFIEISSYTDDKSSGIVKLSKDLSNSIENKDIIIVEDIIDTGLSMSYLLDNLNTRGPASISVCSLLYKPSKTIKKIKIDFLGFEIEDKFVIGYGLDFNQKYRNLPYIGILNRSI